MFTKEMHMRTYNDDDGSFVEVRDDQDSLGLVEIRWVEGNGVEHARMTMLVEMAEKFIDSMKTYMEFKKAN